MPSPDSIHMPPNIWGPIFWATLHIASLGYPDEPNERQQKNMAAFYESMVDVLPCPICRKHFEANLEEMPIKDAIKSRTELIKWVWTMHNQINVQLGKRVYSFQEFLTSMRNLERSKIAYPPSHTNRADETHIKLPSFQHFTIVDGLLLGTGLTLIIGYGLNYLYKEHRKAQ
jgi:hypothetical protein